MNSELIVSLVAVIVAVLAVGAALAGIILNQAKVTREEFRESRKERNQIQDRVTDLEGNLRDRVAWIEGLLGAFTRSPDKEAVLKWRALDKSNQQE